MAKYLIWKCLLQQHGSLFKSLYLLTRKGIELRSITPHEMREHRTGNNRVLPFQTFYEPGHIFRSKPQPVHTGIQLHMDREIGNPLFLGFLNQCVQQVEAVHFRLQLIIEHRLESGHFRIHNDDACRNAGFTQVRTFICHGNSQIIHMMLLQSFGYLIRSGTIGGSLHHTHHFGFGFQFTAIIIQIGNHRTKIHLQYRFVNLSLQNLRQCIETKLTRALNQDYFILQRQFTFSNGINQRSRIRIKSFLDIKS